MTNHRISSRRTRAIAVPIRPLPAGLLCRPGGAQTPGAPRTSSIRTGPSRCRTSGRWAASPGWPWTRTTTSGCMNRPNDLTDIELEAELTPPIADCCVRPPSMIHIDKNGNVIGSFDAPQGHGMAVDSKGFVYIGQDTRPQIRSEDRQAGRRNAAHTREPPGGGGGDAAPADRAFRAAAALARSPDSCRPAGGRGSPRGTRGAAQAAALAAFRAKYPPTTPMIVGGIEEIRLDEAGSRAVRRRQLPGRARDGV